MSTNVVQREREREREREKKICFSRDTVGPFSPLVLQLKVGFIPGKSVLPGLLRVLFLRLPRFMGNTWNGNSVVDS